MDSELKSLEDKIDQLIRLYQGTCEENVRLHLQLENAEIEKQQLTERMRIAAERLEILLNNLPGNRDE